MKFKSKICTNIEQSKRLLKLGLKKETADCGHFYGRQEYEECENWKIVIFDDNWKSYWDITDKGIPAWSLYRIIELIEYNTNIDAIKELLAAKEMFANNLYTAFINIIEYLIQKDEFNKDYLEEKL